MTFSSFRTNAILQRGDGPSEAAKDLQRDLRRLGYLRTGIGGQFGPGTERAVKALQYDLLNNHGRSTRGDGDAPVSVADYNKGRVTDITGICDRPLARCISDMLRDPAFPKLPSAENPREENARALRAVGDMRELKTPLPFLMAILAQESSLRHYRVPTSRNEDNFITVGLDTNASEKFIITSRGYGMGQHTLFHHPPQPQEVRQIMLDPVRNVQRAVEELREKFDRFVNGRTSGTRADDRIKEAGTGNLRVCVFKRTQPEQYLRACQECMRNAGEYDIIAHQTLLYAGSSHRYRPTQYHPKERYEGVPRRKNIPCDWPYAARRYNGAGVNSYHYQTQALLRILKRG